MTAIDAGVKAQVEQAAQGRLNDVAYAISVDKTNLRNSDLNGARVFMDVGASWVAEHGVDNIRIVRIETGEQPRILPTNFIGRTPEGLYRFQGTSPDGLSVFVLAALSPGTPVPSPTPSPAPTATPVLAANPAATIAQPPLATSSPVDTPQSRSGGFSPILAALAGVVIGVATLAVMVSGPVLWRRWRR